MVPEGFDPDRWVLIVRSEHGLSRYFLGGKPHTHYGLMHVWSEEHGDFFTIRKDDVVDASPQARAWIDGFLAGSEPDLHEYLGITSDEAWNLDPDGPEFHRWRADMALARAQGWMPWLVLRPSTPVPENAAYLDPWCWVGGEFWAWSDGAWGVVDPPPPMRDGYLANAICHAKGQHDMDLFGTYMICVDCGDSSEVEIDDDDGGTG